MKTLTSMIVVRSLTAAATITTVVAVVGAGRKW
jgi:hypothetical protein